MNVMEGKRKRLQNEKCADGRINMSGKKIVVLAVAIVLCLLIGVGFGMNGYTGVKDVFTNTTALENTNNLVQIIVGVAMIVGAVIGIWQYVLTARCERAKMNNEQIEKAIKLAEYYKDNILPNYVLVCYIFKKTGIKNILDGVKTASMTNFDKVELGELITKENTEKITQIMESEEMAKVILEADNIFEIGLDKRRISEIKVDSTGSILIDAKTKEWLTKFMSKKVNLLMNNLEYFALNFTHGVADESVVYQSLHQTYLEMVPLLYYDISKNNETNGMQFYTNVVGLYKTWYKQNKEQKDKIAEKGRNVRTGNKAEKI